MIDVVVFQNISILKKMQMFCFEISDFLFEDADLEKKENFDSSGALSDQVLGLDIVEEGD